MYGYRCPECGAFLDPGEKCDCDIEKAAELRREQDSKPKKRTSRKKVGAMPSACCAR